MNRAPALLFVFALGCASRVPYTRAGAKVSVMVVRTEAPSQLEGERVLAAADDGTRRLLLTAQAAWVLRGNAAERTAGARRWTRAALIPAADGRGTWAVGLDDAGHLWRVRPGADVEEISDRYGLAQTRIRAVAAAGGRLVAFLLDDAVAVADGRHVSRYPAPHTRALAAGGRTLALLYDDRVETLALGAPTSPAQRAGEDGWGTSPAQDLPQSLRRRTYPIAAQAIAVDGSGALFAATAHALYRSDDRLLRLAYLADDRLRWLVAAGPRVWFADGDTVLALDDALTIAQGIAAPAEPTAAGDGSLWLVADGRPTRVVSGRTSAAEERWLADVRPVFARSCSECHRPDGKAGVDLSTAAAWLEARDEIRERVVIRRTMPPSGRPLSEDDRAAVAGWMRSFR